MYCNKGYAKEREGMRVALAIKGKGARDSSADPGRANHGATG